MSEADGIALSIRIEALDGEGISTAEFIRCEIEGTTEEVLAFIQNAIQASGASVSGGYAEFEDGSSRELIPDRQQPLGFNVSEEDDDGED